MIHKFNSFLFYSVFKLNGDWAFHNDGESGDRKTKTKFYHYGYIRPAPFFRHHMFRFLFIGIIRFYFYWTYKTAKTIRISKIHLKLLVWGRGYTFKMRLNNFTRVMSGLAEEFSNPRFDYDTIDPYFENFRFGRHK